MQKIKCPACGKDTFEAKYCMHCHAELHPVRPDPAARSDDSHLASLVLRANRAHVEHAALTLVDIGVTDQLPDGSLPNIKKLTVPPGAYTVLVSPAHAPRLLPPGEYNASRLGLGGGLGASVAAGKEVRPLYLCTVSQRPVVSSFALPDHDALGGESGPVPPDHALAAIRALDLRTADNMLGGASVHMIMRCVNPFRLLGMLFNSKLAEMQGRAAILAAKQARANLAQEQSPPGTPPAAGAALSPEELQYLNSCTTLGLVEGKAPEHGGLLGHMFKYPWTLVRWVLWGSNAKTGGLAMLPGRITLADLYPHLRTELAAAILEAVRTENVEPLYRSPEARNRVAMEIQRIMTRSVQIFGIAVDRVAAFRFICPEYEELLARRGQLTLDRAELSDRSQEAEIGQTRREIEAGDARHASTTQKEIETHIASDKAALARHKIQEGRETERQFGELQAERQERDLERDGIAHEHQLEKDRAAEELRLRLHAERERQQHQLQDERERQQLRLQDERERLDLQRQDERLDLAFRWQGRWLELQNSERDAALDRRIKMLELYAKLPKDSVLTIALAENPQLASAYAESMRAQNQQETFQMQERFRAELAKAYANNSQQFAMLLQEAVQQWGQYQAAPQIGQQPPQQVINVALPRPAEGPPSLPGEGSRDSSP
jgi:hypothetical protein